MSLVNQLFDFDSELAANIRTQFGSWLDETGREWLTELEPDRVKARPLKSEAMGESRQELEVLDWYPPFARPLDSGTNILNNVCRAHRAQSFRLSATPSAAHTLHAFGFVQASNHGNL